KKGIVRRAVDQPGYVLVKTGNGRAAEARTARPQGRTTPQKPTGAGSGARRGERTPLRVVLTQILENSTKPMTGSELGEAARKAGWRTSSQRPADVVWAMLNQMDNVEHVKGEGYRLKRGRR